MTLWLETSTINQLKPTEQSYWYLKVKELQLSDSSIQRAYMTIDTAILFSLSLIKMK